MIAEDEKPDLSEESRQDIRPAAARQQRRLSPQERATLRQCEVAIPRGLRSFIEAGRALATIRNQRLYREHHRTFRAYCQARWGFDASRARQLIAAADVVRDLEGADVTPTNENQVRPLIRLDPDFRKEVWSKAIEITAGVSPTQDQVKEAIEQLAPPETEDDIAARRQQTADVAALIDHARVLMERFNIAVNGLNYREGLTLEGRQTIVRAINTLQASLRDLRGVL
jgi:hypothetical protein